MSPSIIERVPHGCAPREPLQPWQRRNIWRCKYDRLSIEQQLEPGAWPFSPSAVHNLPRELQTNPRQLAASNQ